MFKKRFTLFAILLVFWLVVSTQLDLEHVVVGGFLSLLVAWIWQELNPTLPRCPSLRDCWQMLRCVSQLVVAIIESNLMVAKTILFPQGAIKPVIVRFQPSLRSDWGRVLLANCITLTPGTVTVDVNPDSGEFMVYTLTAEAANGVLTWELIDEIQKLECGRCE